MKKIFLFILVFVIGLYCVSFNTVYAYTDTVEEYKVNAPDWSNDEWNLFDNCTHFAIDVWNSVSDDDLTKHTILTPTNVIEQIDDRDNYQVNRSIFGNSNRVGYYSGYNSVHSTT